MYLFHRSWLAAAIVAVASGCSVSGLRMRSRAEIRDRLAAPCWILRARWLRMRLLRFINAVSGYDRTTTTDSKGNFSFPNVPFNPYHMTVTVAGFAPYAQDVEIRSVVAANVKVSLTVAGTPTR